jgi:hypothetical protein
MTTPTLYQWPTDDLRQTRDPMTALDQEWLARHDAGQYCEIWDIAGGTDTFGGFSVLWVPDEHVFWAFNAGLEPAWYVSPFTRDLTFGLLGEPGWGQLFPQIRGYVPRSTVCESCGGALAPDDRDRTAYFAIEAAVWEPQCASCFDAAVDETD